MRTAFTTEIRLLLCEGCGAPLEAPVQGGLVACAYCRAQNHVRVRDERPTKGPAFLPPAFDETERLARLRAQDGRPVVPPPSVLALLDASGGLAAWRVAEAFAIFRDSCREVRATSSPEAAERVYFLALVLDNHLAEARDAPRTRAVLETALDTLTLPRHLQVLRCLLCRAALREGDGLAAAQWLAPTDPRSDELESDSSYRFARALLDTARGDFAAVVSLLGAEDDAVPISDMLDPVVAVLRANALEQRGDLERAVRVLTTRLEREGPRGRAAIERFVANTTYLRLCPASLPRAREHAAPVSVGVLGGAVSGLGSMSRWLFVSGLACLGIAAFVFFVSTRPVWQVLLAPGAPVRLAMVAPLLENGAIAALGPSIAGVVCLAVGAWIWASGRAARQLRTRGVQTHATVLACEATGLRLNGHRVMQLKVQLTPTGAAPYEAEFPIVIALEGLPPAVGSSVPVRVHPHRRGLVMLDPG